MQGFEGLDIELYFIVCEMRQVEEVLIRENIIWLTFFNDQFKRE